MTTALQDFMSTLLSSKCLLNSSTSELLLDNEDDRWTISRREGTIEIMNRVSMMLEEDPVAREQPKQSSDIHMGRSVSLPSLGDFLPTNDNDLMVRRNEISIVPDNARLPPLASWSSSTGITRSRSRTRTPTRTGSNSSISSNSSNGHGTGRFLPVSRRNAPRGDKATSQSRWGSPSSSSFDNTNDTPSPTEESKGYLDQFRPPTHRSSLTPPSNKTKQDSSPVQPPKAPRLSPKAGTIETMKSMETIKGSDDVGQSLVDMIQLLSARAAISMANYHATLDRKQEPSNDIS